MSMSVCPPVCMLIGSHNSKAIYSQSLPILCMLPVAVARSSSSGIVIRYVLLILCLTSCFRNGHDVLLAAVVKVRGPRRAQPHLLLVWPPLLKFQPWLARNLPCLHCIQNHFICVFFLCVYLFVCLSCRSYTLNTNSLSIICIFICAPPCFYHVATAIRHFMTDSRCICLIHLCKVVFLNLPPLPSTVTLTTG